MNKFRVAIVLFFNVVIGITSLSMSSCKRESNQGSIILTCTTGSENSKLSFTDLRKINLRTEIIEIEQGKPDASPKLLTSSFYSARSPEISNDGRFMIFAGQKKDSDKWQIWETDLQNLHTRQLTELKGDCTDPAFLPPGRFLFTSHSAIDSLKAEESILTSNIDGTEQKRITYNPNMYMSSKVLNDGRVLTLSVRKYPETGEEKLMVMRPDGTKFELFYKGADGASISGPGFETNNGKIIFIESEKNNPGRGNLVSVSYNRPLHSRQNLTSGIDGDFRAVFPQPSGKFLVSFRKKPAEKYSLYEFDAENKSLGKPIYSSSESDIIEVAGVVVHPRSRKLPSEVNPVIKTGLIMCQDVNVEDNPLNISGIVQSKTTKVEIMGTDSSMGVFRPSGDGSFYLKVVANKPFQIRTIDEYGKVIRKCDWIWLRPNERRGCVGCHEDQDIVPDNRIAFAVKKAPTGIPVHVNKIKDKMIDTE